MKPDTVRRLPSRGIGQAEQARRDEWRREIDLLTDLLELNGAGSAARSRAEWLLRKSGNLGATLSTGALRLKALGATDSEIRTLHLVRNAVTLTLRRRAYQRPQMKSLSAVLDYLRADMANKEHELARCLMLSAHNHLLHDEIIGIGTLQQVEVHPRRVAQLALEHNAAAVILVHNHPSGVSAPSRNDYIITTNVKLALATFGILLHDHIIMTRSGHVSLKDEGFL